jgi:T5SS/PEP-CTERM-associated repeat protein
VDGVGSTWTNSADIEIGAHGGNGSLLVQNGGTVTSADAEIGHDAGSTGTATVDGAGSTWTLSSDLEVGTDGDGTLFVTNGGSVSSIGGSVAFDTGSTGTATVDGAGSMWTVTGELTVGGNSMGPGGTGVLNVQNGGVVTATGGMMIWAGGTLAGDGTVVANVENAGLVSPGTSPGTLTITGNYTQDTGGTLRIEIAGLADPQHDLLSISGTGSLDGTLQLVKLANFAITPGDRITVLSAGGGLGGTMFSSVDSSSFVGLIQPTVVYTATTVDVVFDLSNTFLSQALTFNQSAVAAELDEVVGDPRADDLIAFVGHEPLGNLPHDYDLIAPEELASIYEIGFSQAVVSNMNLQHRMDDIRAGSNGFCANGYQAQETGGYSKDSDGKVAIDKNPTPAFVPSPENRWGIFVTGSGDFVNVGDHDSNAHGYDITTGNVIVGADYRICDHFAIGIDGGYSGSTADLVDRGRVEVDGGKAGAYASLYGYKILGSIIHIDGAVSGGWNSYDTNRTGLEDLPVRGSTNGSELNAMLAYGGDWHFGCLLIGTWSTLQYTNVNIDKFTETGSLAPLEIQDQNEDSFRTSTGLRIAYDIKAGNAIIRPEVRAAWQHEYADRAYSIDSRFASGAGDVFTVHGPAIGRDSALVDAGLAVQLSNRWSIYAYYDGVLGRSNYDNNAVSGGVRFGF